MTTEASFMRAIIENPADDSPRLIFADWLEENGQPERAEFIRVQCELANIGLSIGPDGNRWIRTGCAEDQALKNKLYRRERELRWRQVQRWKGQPGKSFPAELRWVEEAFGDMIHADPRHPHAIQSWIFRRGFIAEITCTFAFFAKHGAEILRSQPVEKVTLTEVADRFNFTLSFRENEAIRVSSLREIVLVPAAILTRNRSRGETYAYMEVYAWWLRETLPGISVIVRGECEMEMAQHDLNDVERAQGAVNSAR